jgi:hypothetical protein
VGDEQRRIPFETPQLLQLEPHALARENVEGAERLVHQQESRSDQKRPANRHALLHPAGQLMRVMIFEAGKTRKLDQLEGLRAIARSRIAAHLDAEQDVAQHRAPGHEDGRLEDHAGIA